MNHDNNETDEGPASLEVPKRRIGRVRMSLLLGLLLLMSTQYLNHTGFCYAEMKYLSERELMDRVLFGSNARSMTDNEKVDDLRARTGAEYPDCCRVSKFAFGWSRFTILFNSALGNYRYGFEYSYPADKAKTGSEDLFQWYEHSINSCGSSAHTGFGESNSQASYEAILRSNNKNWRRIEDADRAD
ncbi:MAG: hypothetical protein KJ017_00105 [Alphaproteobacteria bacterium]|nr:hypothetical protein [Alphaproteobacteria bacterium]